MEIGKTQACAELFGEISFFSPDRERTLTARCETDCLILRIDEPAFKQLYFHNPKFAFQISNLIAYRLSAPEAGRAIGAARLQAARLRLLEGVHRHRLLDVEAQVHLRERADSEQIVL